MFHIAQSPNLLHETLGLPVTENVRAEVARVVAVRVLVSFAVIALGVSIGAGFA